MVKSHIEQASLCYGFDANSKAHIGNGSSWLCVKFSHQKAISSIVVCISAHCQHCIYIVSYCSSASSYEFAKSHR